MVLADFPVNCTITSNEEVRGVTSLDNKLFVLRNAQRDQVDVYEKYDDYYGNPVEYYSVPGDHVWDITHNVGFGTVCISDYREREVYEVSLTDASLVDTLRVDNELRGLSVCNYNILVTCRHPSALVALDCRDLTINKKILLDETIDLPWHAVQLSTGNFAVCHGSGTNMEHRVCTVDRSGRIIRSFGSGSGSDKFQLNVPCHLAVDENDFIFVADCLNERVVLLTPKLNFVDYVIENMDSRPQRLYLDRNSKDLYVGKRNGDVVVIQL